MSEWAAASAGAARGPPRVLQLLLSGWPGMGAAEGAAARTPQSLAQHLPARDTSVALSIVGD